MTTEEFTTGSGNRAEVASHSASKVHAVLDDLRLASSTLTSIGGQCLDHQIQVGVIGWKLPLAADLLSPSTAAPCEAHVFNLTLGSNSLGARGTAALRFGVRLSASIAAYEAAESIAGFAVDSVERQVASVRLALAIGYGLNRFREGASPGEALTDSIDAFPDAAAGGPAAVASLGAGGGYALLVKVLGSLGNDQARQGGPVTVTQEHNPGARPAPAARSISESAERINDLHRNGSQAAHIQAQRVVGADGQGRWVVLIPGTQDFTGNRPNPADGTGILQSLAGHPSAMTGAVASALAAAQKAEGVYGKSEPVMLVGHSQGGMVASNMARDPKIQENFRVTKVATFGSPVTHMKPGAVELDVVNTRDIVPAGSGTDDGADDENRTRLRIDDRTSMTNSDGNREYAGAHDAKNYGNDYQDALTSSDADSALRRFDASTRPYFTGQARTYVYDAHRAAPPGE